MNKNVDRNNKNNKENCNNEERVKGNQQLTDKLTIEQAMKQEQRTGNIMKNLDQRQ